MVACENTRNKSVERSGICDTESFCINEAAAVVDVKFQFISLFYTNNVTVCGGKRLAYKLNKMFCLSISVTILIYLRV